MKKLLLPILWMAAVVPLLASPTIEGATVTLPYVELASLVERVNTLERSSEERVPEPPVSVIVDAARYTLNCEDVENATLLASFGVSNLSDEWQWVPLFEAGVSVRSVEPRDAKVVEADGQLMLLLEPSAETSVEIEVRAGQSPHLRGGRTLVAFDAVAAFRSSLVVEQGALPSKLVVVGAVASDVEDGHFGLPSSGGMVRVEMYEAEALEGARWNGSVQYLIDEAEGSMRVQARMRLQAADNGRTSTVELKLPAVAEVVSVESAGIEGPPETAMTSRGQLLRLRWDDEESLTRIVDVAFVLPMDYDSEIWRIDGVKVSNVSTWKQRYYLRAFDGMGLHPVHGDWTQLGVVPEWIAEQGGSAGLRHVRIDDADSLALSARVLPRLKTSVATVRLAKYRTQLVEEGGMLHQATVIVEHGSSASYRFALPDGAKLLSCAIENRNVEPVVLGDGELLLELSAPHRSSSNTSLSYAYTTDDMKLNPVEGKAELALPLTPLFIHRLNWDIDLPEDYEATALEGNVVIDEGGGQVVRLSKKICHGERPYAALYYTRRDLNR